MAAEGLADLERSVARRLARYVDERFPPTEYVPASVVFFLAAYLTAAALTGRIVSGATIVIGAATTVLVFFHLRLMDEIKDADHDALHYPQRPVPRGLVSLAEIRALLGGCLAIEVVLNASLSPAALAAYAVVGGFTLLMYREFFVGALLRANFLVYTLVHMPSLPLLAVYAYVLALGAAGVRIEPAFALFLIATYAIGLSLEIARKFHAPEGEPAVYTYTKHLGTRGATVLLASLVVTVTAAMAVLGATLGWGVSYALPLLAFAAVALGGLLRFAAAPSERRAHCLEKVFVPLAGVGSYLLILAHAVFGTPR